MSSYSHSQTSELFPEFFSLDVDGNDLRVAYVSSHPFDQVNTNIDRIIMMIHGANRNQVSYDRVLTAAQDSGVADTTLIFMPQFLESEDIAPLSVPDDVLYWGSGWRQGDLSNRSFPARISSFEVANRIIAHLLGNNPSVEKVIITGHSAGGQYSQRFAAGSGLEQTLAPMGITVRYVPSNPSSFVYLNDRRRVPGTVDQFAELTSSQISSCPKYNEYRYGLDDLNNFMSGIGRSQILSQYQVRDVRYIQGEDDTGTSQLDLDCEAIHQGEDRIERGIILYNHIRDAFGGEIQETHQQVIVPDLGHSSRTLTTPCGMNFLFDIGECNIATPGNLAADVDGNVVSLDWTDHADGESGYRVERSVDGGAAFAELAVVDVDADSYVDDTIDPLFQYHYRIRTLAGSIRSGFSNTVIVGADLPIQTPVPTPTPTPTATPAELPGADGGGGALNMLFLLLLTLSKFLRKVNIPRKVD